MSRQPIVQHGESAALLLSPAELAALGLQIGDVLDVKVVDGQLVLRPSNEASQRTLVDEAADDVLQRRRSAFERLA